MSTLKTNNIEHLDAATPSIQTTIGGGVVFAGLSTFQGNAQFDGNVNIAGTVTYDDVTNIDSVGIVTAQSGLNVGPKTGIACTISSAGAITAAGNAIFGANIVATNDTTGLNWYQNLGMLRIQQVSSQTGSCFNIYKGGVNAEQISLKSDGNAIFTGIITAANALLRSSSTSDGPVLQFDGAGPNGTF